MAPVAEEYVFQRLERSKEEYNQPLDLIHKVVQILVELDGCHLIALRWGRSHVLASLN